MRIKKNYRSLLHCRSRSDNVQKSTVGTPEQGGNCPGGDCLGGDWHRVQLSGGNGLGGY